MIPSPDPASAGLGDGPARAASRPTMAGCSAIKGNILHGLLVTKMQ